MEWLMTGDRASHITSRGEYAVALNCTITNATEKTIAVSAIMPEAIVDRITWAEPSENPSVRAGNRRASSRGSRKATTTPATA
jgi:hypothetical protein